MRMQLISGEQGLTVNIQADRPETLDLLRRHIDELARDLADAGFEGAAFTFGNGEPGGDGEPGGEQSRSASGKRRTDGPSGRPERTGDTFHHLRRTRYQDLTHG